MPSDGERTPRGPLRQSVGRECPQVGRPWRPPARDRPVSGVTRPGYPVSDPFSAPTAALSAPRSGPAVRTSRALTGTTGPVPPPSASGAPNAVGHVRGRAALRAEARDEDGAVEGGQVETVVAARGAPREPDDRAGRPVPGAVAVGRVVVGEGVDHRLGDLAHTAPTTRGVRPRTPRPTPAPPGRRRPRGWTSGRARTRRARWRPRGRGPGRGRRRRGRARASARRRRAGRRRPARPGRSRPSSSRCRRAWRRPR